MGVVLMTAEFFLLALGLGVGAFYPIVDIKETGSGFPKLIAGVCAGSLFFAWVLHMSYGSIIDPQSILYYMAIFSHLLMYFFHGEKRSVGMWVLYLVILGSLMYLLLLFNNHVFSIFFAHLITSLFIGVITFAMTLGHYYLVVPKLSTRPLEIAVVATWILLIAKIGITASTYFKHGELFEGQTRVAGGYLFNWVMLTMRVVWGYLIIGAMSIFTWRLVRIRSTQSATGMLYAMVFFLIVGEVIAAWFYFNYGKLL